MRDRNRILVIGGTGKVGRELVKALLAQDAQVRVLTRNVQAASALFEGMNLPEDHFQDLEFTQGDLEEHGLLDLLLEDSDRAFLLCPPCPEQVAWNATFIQAAGNAGMRRLVRLSAAGADPTSPVKLLSLHGESDAALVRSKVPSVILRPHYFMQNLLASAPSIIGHHDFYAPMGEGRVGCVDLRDVAEVAAHSLLHPEQPPGILTLTGPESLSFREMAAELSEAVGHAVAYIPVSPLEAENAMQGAGLSPWLAQAVVELLDAFRMGVGDYTTHGVEAVLGRKPRSFRAFAMEHAAKFSGKVAAGRG